MAEEVRKVVKLKCTKCGETVDPKGAHAHYSNVHRDVGEWEEVKESLYERIEVEEKAPPSPPKKPEEEEKPKPPHIMAQDEAIEFLERELPNIYGISRKQADQAIERLKQRPELVWNPQALDYHVRQYSGKNLNVYDLGWVLARVQEMLGQSGAPQAQPPFMPPTAPTQPWAPPSMMWQPWQQGGWQPWPWGARAQRQPEGPPKPPKTYKIVVDEQEIETDEKGFLAWRKYLDDREERERRREELKKGEPMVEVPTLDGKGTVKVPASQAVAHMQTLVLQQQLAETRKPEAKVAVPISKDKTAEVPVSQAPYMMQTQWAQAERERAEREAEGIRKAYDELSKQMTPEAVARRAEAMGYIRTGSPAFGLISQARKDFETKTDRLFGMLEKGRLGAPGAPTREIPRYTPEEREKKAEEIRERIGRAERLTEGEEAVIRSAKKVRDESKSS